MDGSIYIYLKYTKTLFFKFFFLKIFLYNAKILIASQNITKLLLVILQNFPAILISPELNTLRLQSLLRSKQTDKVTQKLQF